MIKPNKFLDLDNCMINIATEIIKLLSEKKAITYSALYSKLNEKFPISLEYNFLPSIDFLYLFGIIKYSPETDSLELIK